MKDEGSELVTNCNRLKIPAKDGKMRLSDIATTNQLLHLIQSAFTKSGTIKTMVSLKQPQLSFFTITPILSYSKSAFKNV